MTIDPNKNMRVRKSIVAGISFLAFFGAALLPIAVNAQSNQLMLADILIALRSKKVSLAERNDIISKAVTARGITFGLTPEIEKELTDTGAEKILLDAIRQKATMVKVAAVNPPIETKPKQEPVITPPDFAFYQKKADSEVSKGMADAAIADYTKAIEMNPKAADAYIGRAAIFAAKQSSSKAVADYGKALEIKPDNVAVRVKLAELLEKKGDVDAALVEYNKALATEASNESAKSAVARISADKAKALEIERTAALKAATAAAPPEFVELGSLANDSSAVLVKPIYPATAARSNVVGLVVVDVTLDEEGKVVTAKATSGPALLKQSAELAAMRSKFKPGMWKGKPNKAKGYVSYNFTNGR
jgi:TonB family protein